VSLFFGKLPIFLPSIYSTLLLAKYDFAEIFKN